MPRLKSGRPATEPPPTNAHAKDESSDMPLMARLVDELEPVPLAAARQAAGLSQVALANLRNTSQAAVHNSEHWKNPTLGRLRDYVDSTGARVWVVMQLADGQVVQLDIASLKDD